MQTNRLNTIIAIIGAAALLFPFTSQGQLGSLGKVAGVATGTVTAASLNADLFGGLDFFSKANIKFSEALLPKEQAAKIKAQLEAASADNDHSAAQAANKQACEQNKAAAEELIKKSQALSEEQKKLVKEGQGEAAKGVAKWGAVGASLALAAKSGNTDAQLATAIPAAQQMIQDLPDINKMLGTINKLNKIK